MCSKGISIQNNRIYRTWHVRLPQNTAERVTSISLRIDEMSFKPGTAAALMEL